MTNYLLIQLLILKLLQILNIAQFVNRKTREWLIENVKAHNAKIAAAAARQAALDAVNINITDPQIP